MNLKQVEILATQGESPSLEYKASTAQLKAAFETICGYLNGNGGVVLIGVKNNGQILGQDVTDNTLQEIAREVKKIEPPAQGQIEIQIIPTKNGKSLIVLKAHKGQHAPYTFDGRPFERIQSTTSRMPQQRYDQLVAHRIQISFSWEMLIAEGYTVDSLDRDLILGVIRKSVEVERMPEQALRQDIPIEKH